MAGSRTHLPSSLLLWLVVPCTAVGCAGFSGHPPRDLVAGDRARHAPPIERSVVLTAGAALVLQVTGLDGEVAAWARRHRPLYGVSATAASNVLLDASRGTHALAALVPGRVREPFATRATRVVVDVAAANLTLSATSIAKDATSRTRPNGSDQRSFPSSHASESAARSAGAKLELETRGVAPAIARPLAAVATLLPYAAGWARVEGGRHYPSDVLAGVALGRILPALVHELVDGTPGGHPALAVTTRASAHGVALAIVW